MRSGGPTVTVLRFRKEREMRCCYARLPVRTESTQPARLVAQSLDWGRISVKRARRPGPTVCYAHCSYEWHIAVILHVASMRHRFEDVTVRSTWANPFPQNSATRCWADKNKIGTATFSGFRRQLEAGIFFLSRWMPLKKGAPWLATRNFMPSGRAQRSRCGTPQ